MVKLKELGKSLWRDRTLVLMALPAVIILIMFNYVPMTGLVLAFKKFDFSLGLYDSPWNGLENFKNLFLVGDTFWRMTRNTVGYYFLLTTVGMVCEVALAIAINELVFKKAAKYMHCVMIMPTFISYVAVSMIVEALLNYNTGMINGILADAGAKKINFYLQAKFWPFILTLVDVWKGTGYGSVLYLSTLAGVDPQLYESATIDGANGWQRLRYITLPMLVPMMMIRFLLSLGNIMSSGTGLFYQVTKNSGALYSTTQVLDSYVLNAIMNNNGNYGVTSAVTLYKSIVGCIMVVVVNKIVRKVSPDNALY